MAAADTVDLKSSTHGWYQTRLMYLDEMIQEYGRYTPEQLSRIIAKRLGVEYYMVTTVTEGLFILAELDGYATN